MLTVATEAEPGCGCDSQPARGKLMPVDIALHKGLNIARAVEETEFVSLLKLSGRVLAEDVTAPFPLPPFDNSAMDGYAVRSADCTGDQPVRLGVTGRVAAGADAEQQGIVGAGQAFRIFTGAALPPGADAVIMQEHVIRDGDAITISRPVSAGSNVRWAGEDAKPGSVLVRAGTMLGAREIAAIASVGLMGATVRRKLRVALFCTGDELRQPGQKLAPGQIYNSNRFMMLSDLEQNWIDVLDFGAVEDDPEQLRKTLAEAAQRVDVVVTTGGVSVGDEDHMIDQLQAAGGRIEVMKIAMKPGKPLAFGQLGDALYIGLPGNPVAAYTTWQVIGRKIAERCAGMRESTPTLAEVELDHDTRRSPGRLEYRPAIIVDRPASGRPRVKLLDASFSAKVSLVCQADGFAILPAQSRELAAGTMVGFLPL